MGNIVESAYRELVISARAHVSQVAVAEWVERRLRDAGIDVATVPVSIFGAYSDGGWAEVRFYLPAHRDAPEDLAQQYRLALGVGSMARSFNEDNGNFEWYCERPSDGALPYKTRVYIIGTPEHGCEIEKIEETVKTVRYKAKCRDENTGPEFEGSAEERTPSIKAQRRDALGI